MYYRAKSPYSNIIFKRRLNIYPLILKLRRAGYKVKLDRDVIPLEYDNELSQVRIELSDGYIIVELTDTSYKIVYTSNNYEFLNITEESLMNKGFEGLKNLIASTNEGTNYTVNFEVVEGLDSIPTLIEVLTNEYTDRLSGPVLVDNTFTVTAIVDIERVTNDVLAEALKLGIVLKDILN